MSTHSERRGRRRFAATLGVMTALVGCSNPPPAEPRNFVVYFRTGDATVTQEAHQVIANAATSMRTHPPAKIVVEGHADGGTTFDASLADQRALAVIQALVADGTDASSIEKLPGAPSPGETGLAAHQVIIRFMP